MVKQATYFENSQGFSLVELMVTIAILVLLAVIGVRLGQAWIANSKIVETQGKLQLVFEKAQAYAVRNPNGVVGSNSAVNLSISSGKFIAATTEATPVTIWQETIDTRVTVTLKPNGCTTIGLSNQGRNISTSCDGNYSVASSGGTTLDGKFN